MITKLKVQDGRKMLALGMAAGLLLAAPLGIRAYANEDETTTPPDETETTDPETTPEEETTEEPVIEEPTQEEQEETPVDETPVEQTEEPEEVPVEPGEEETTEDPTVADLQAAITIAALEHPDVEVISAKIKTLEGSKVYKVVFADGWIAYVSADTGDVMLLRDQNGQKRTCHNFARKHWLKKHHDWAPWKGGWHSWSAAWLQKQQWAAQQYDWQWQEAPEQTGETEVADPTTEGATDGRTTQVQTLQGATLQTRSQSGDQSKSRNQSRNQNRSQTNKQSSAGTSSSKKKTRTYANFKSGYQQKLQGGGKHGTPKYQTVYGSNGGSYYNPWAGR